MLAPETLIQGRYLVVRQIGKGGMGAVYEAHDQRLRSRVALKQMIGEGDQLGRAFEREAQILASLRHAALPRVIDYFRDEHGHFLVMEYIPGEDLMALLSAREAPFDVGTVLGWADRLLDALAYLHGQEPPVIHRDIKPQNLKLTPSGEIILIDFGLAKGIAAQGMTTASLFGYTPQYAPLEQIKGSGTGARSDLYALAATLYHLLTNQPPPDALTRAAATISREPDPLLPAHALNPAVPPDLSAVLAQSLALDPAMRFVSAVVMRRALQSVELLGDPAPGAVIRAPQPARQAPEMAPGAISQPAPSVADATTRPGSLPTPAPISAPLPPAPPTPPPIAAPRGRPAPPEPRPSGRGVCLAFALGTLLIFGLLIFGAGLLFNRAISQVSELSQTAVPNVLSVGGTAAAQVGSAQETAIVVQQTALAGAAEAQGTAVALATAAADQAPSIQQTALAAAAQAQGTAAAIATQAAGDVLIVPQLPVGEAEPVEIDSSIEGEVVVPGVPLAYTFAGSEGQQVFVETRSYDQALSGLPLVLSGPSGAELVSSCLGCGNVGVVTLTADGVYTLLVGGREPATGRFELALFDVPAPEVFDITVGGAPVALEGEIGAPGARQIYAFEGRDGQQVFVRLVDFDSGMDQIGVRLLGPDGGEVGSTCLGCGQLGLQTLPRAGRYTLVVGSDREPITGDYALALSDVPPPRTFALGVGTTIAGDVPGPGAGTIAAPGASNEFTFEAAEGQQVLFEVLSFADGMEQIGLTLRDPAGVEVFATCLGCGDPGVRTLDRAGRYTLIVGSDRDAATGAFELRVAAP